MRYLILHVPVLIATLTLSATTVCAQQSDKGKKKSVVAGKADVLRSVPKRFAAYLGSDAKKGTVQLQFDDEKAPTTWRLNPDAEIKIRGWWGRLDQLQAQQRIWVWLDVDRKRKPISILMLADELSEQDIHDKPLTLKAVDVKRQTITVRSFRGKERTLTLAKHLRVQGNGDKWEVLTDGKVVYRYAPDSPVWVESVDGVAHLVLSEGGFEEARRRQQSLARERWKKEGLPGTVLFLHKLGGEMELMLDHEAMRWGRYLKTGDDVTIQTSAPVKATVKEVRPWRERTMVRLVTNSGVDQASLTPNQRVTLKVPEPPKEVRESELPTDLGRLKLKEERIQWIHASTYCTCRVKGDRCTGMFYSLASCNVNACGMPNRIRGSVAKMIDDGMSDKQILEALLKERGSGLLKPHLLP